MRTAGRTRRGSGRGLPRDSRVYSREIAEFIAERWPTDGREMAERWPGGAASPNRPIERKGTSASAAVSRSEKAALKASASSSVLAPSPASPSARARKNAGSSSLAGNRGERKGIEGESRRNLEGTWRPQRETGPNTSMSASSASRVQQPPNQRHVKSLVLQQRASLQQTAAVRCGGARGRVEDVVVGRRPLLPRGACARELGHHYSNN